MIFPCLQGSKAQLEQVWEETDGLEAKDFNPKTFFKLHGMCYGVFQFVVKSAILIISAKNE